MALLHLFAVCERRRHPTRLQPQCHTHTGARLCMQVLLSGCACACHACCQQSNAGVLAHTNCTTYCQASGSTKATVPTIVEPMWTCRPHSPLMLGVGGTSPPSNPPVRSPGAGLPSTPGAVLGTVGLEAAGDVGSCLTGAGLAASGVGEVPGLGDRDPGAVGEGLMPCKRSGWKEGSGMSGSCTAGEGSAGLGEIWGSCGVGDGCCWLSVAAGEG